MSARVAAERPALIRIRTLLDILSRRIRSPAEHASHARLQAIAESALADLLDALGDLDEQPLKLAIAERDPLQDAD